MTGLYILSGALLLDILLGEAPNRFHPVAWLGKLISLQLRLTPRTGNIRRFVCGMAMVILTTVMITIPLYFLKCHCEAEGRGNLSVGGVMPQDCFVACGLLATTFLGGEAAAAAAADYFYTGYLQNLNTIACVLFSIYLLKNTFSLRGLWQAVEKVKLSLSSNDLDEARRHATALVSRDTANLTQARLMSATIESCAENLCDSFVAPLFYFAVFGLPGAVAYRIVNTFDAMIGFHGKWEYTGKFAARLDDILNFIPARLSALLIIMASAICRAGAGRGWQTMLKQHSLTESPNAGWTMSAMAGALGIILDKAGAYTLGSHKNELTTAAIGQSQAILLTAASIWGIIAIAKEALVNVAG